MPLYSAYSPLGTGIDPSEIEKGVWVEIETITLTVNGTITFSSIPATFDKLMLVGSLRSTKADTVDMVNVFFNGDTTTTNYNHEYINASGASLSSATLNAVNGIRAAAANAAAGLFTPFKGVIPNYSTGQLKSIFLNGGPHNYLMVVSGWWNNVAVIDTILLDAAGGDLLAGSKMSLLGYVEG